MSRQIDRNGDSRPKLRVGCILISLIVLSLDVLTFFAACSVVGCTCNALVENASHYQHEDRAES